MDSISEISVTGINEMISTFNEISDSFGKHEDTKNFLKSAESAILKAQELLTRTETSIEAQSIKSYAVTAYQLIHGISEDFSLFKLFEQCVSDKRWKSLTNMVTVCSKFMSVCPIPSVVISGSTYFSSHGPPNIRPDDDTNIPKYNIVSVDQLNSPIMWPNVIHELCHFKIEDGKLQDQIYGYLNNFNLDIESTEDKIEEAICDCMSTLILGPSYPYSFLAQYFQVLGNTHSTTHPNDAFRLKIMTQTLRECHMIKEYKNIEVILNNSLAQSWKEDELFPVLDQIIDETIRCFDIPHCTNFRKNLSLHMYKNSTNSDLYSLFNEGWNIIYSTHRRDHRIYREVSNVILKRLESESFSLYPSS